jgi:outer membrane protein W
VRTNKAKAMKRLALILLICHQALGTSAQDTKTGGLDFDQCFIFAWDVNVPVGKNRPIDKTSWAGAKIEYRKKVAHNITVGLDFSWNTFNEYKPSKTYHISSSTDITTDLYKHIYTLPLALTGHYYFPVNSKIFIPYAGIGLGATYADINLYANIYQLRDETWGFLARPEAGLIIKFTEDANTGIIIGARYSISTNKADEFNIKNLQSFGFHIGLIWSAY